MQHDPPLPPPPCQRRPPLHDAVAALGNWKVSYFWDWSINHQFLIFCFLKIPDVFLVVPIKIPMSHHILWVSAPATSEKKTKPIALARQPLAPPLPHDRTRFAVVPAEFSPCRFAKIGRQTETATAMFRGGFNAGGEPKAHIRNSLCFVLKHGWQIHGF